MKVTLFVKDGDNLMGPAIERGITAHGDKVVRKSATREVTRIDTDYAAFIGINQYGAIKFYKKAGHSILYFDRGHNDRHSKRPPEYRVSVNEHMPTKYIATAAHGPERWLRMGRTMLPWRSATADGHIIVANSSEKFHLLHRLPPPKRWAEEIVMSLAEFTKRSVWYRPKPRWREKTPIKGTIYATGYLRDVLAGAHLLITYGSYICVEALISGIPSIVLGNGVTRAISSTSLAESEAPRLASDEGRRQILANLAWCQYSIEEWRSGFAWQKTKELMINGAKP